MLRCWHLVWILVRTDHPCLGVGCHMGQDENMYYSQIKEIWELDFHDFNIPLFRCNWVNAIKGVV
jgi:hypothetical protein